MTYFDTCSDGDFGKVISFLQKNNVTIAARDKLRMTIAAKVPKSLTNRMENEIKLMHNFTIGKAPLWQQ